MKARSPEHWPELVYRARMGLDGLLCALPDYAQEPGYRAMVGTVNGILLGSHTLDELQRAGPWPWPGLPALCLSQRTLQAPDPALQIRALSVPAAMDWFAAQGARRLWLLGGGALASSTLGVGALSELDLEIEPRIVGNGTAVFAGGSQPQVLDRLTCTEVEGRARLQARLRPAS